MKEVLGYIFSVLQPSYVHGILESLFFLLKNLILKWPIRLYFIYISLKNSEILKKKKTTNKQNIFRFLVFFKIALQVSDQEKNKAIYQIYSQSSLKANMARFSPLLGWLVPAFPLEIFFL